jgi:hypothetical protein
LVAAQGVVTLGEQGGVFQPAVVPGLAVVLQQYFLVKVAKVRHF